MVTLGTFGLMGHWTGLDIIATGLFLFYAARRQKMEAPYLYVQHLASKNRDLEKCGVMPGEVLVARGEVPVWRITQQFVPQRYHLVYMVDRQGQYTGIVGETEVIRVLLEEGAHTPLERLKKGF
jgi:stage IV sporulation protein FB